MKRIWITWERHRRTRELVLALDNLELFELELEAHRLFRYPYLLFKTVSVLIKECPNLVIVQNPSVILSLFMISFGKLFTTYVIVDAHNGGLKPFCSKYNWLLPAYNVIQKHADLTIVTNEMLAHHVRQNGGHPFVIEDKLPQFKNIRPINLKGDYNFVFVCTFEKDEPYEEVIQAANLINNSINIYVTGNYKKISRQITENTPPNLVFTGYLPQKDYENLIFSCDAVIDLTIRENCLVCGAYEAVALGKSIIISNTYALRSYFNLGSVYTDNTAEAVAKAIEYTIKNKEKLEREIVILKNRLQHEWKKRFRQFVLLLDSFVGKNNK